MRDRERLNQRELATLLAALRLWQRRRDDGDLSGIATNEGAVVPLDDFEIDELCDRMNSGPVYLPR